MRAWFTGLWRHADFLRLWVGQTISVFGSMIGGAAVEFTAILFLGAGPAEMALLGAARLAPACVIGLLAGAWIDRLRRRPLLIAADLGRALALGSIPLTALLGLLRVEQLYAVAFVTSILTLVFDVAYQSYLPSLVRRDELVEGNSKLSASASVAEIGGFGLGGWLVQLLTAPIAVLVDAFSFLASAVALGLIRAAEPAPAPAAGRPRLLAEIVEGLRAIAADPLLRAMAAATLTYNVAFGLIGTVILLFVSRELGFSPGVAGLIFAVGGVSSLLGALAAGPVTRRLGLGPTMIAGLALMGLSTFTIPLAQGATLAAALLLIAQQLFGDGGFTIYTIAQVSLRQAIVPERLLGRVISSMKVVGLGASLLGVTLGGLLGEAAGLRPTLLLGSGLTLLAALWLLLSPARRLGRAGEGVSGRGGELGDRAIPSP